MKLEQIYKDIIEETKLIPEIGEGSSQPFPYKETIRGDDSFIYEIDGEVRNDTGEFILQEIPIKLQGLGFPIEVDQENEVWTIDGVMNHDYGEFLNVTPGTTLKALEIAFVKIGKASRGQAYSLVNDRVFMFRLMATIKKILQMEFAKDEPDLITYSPTKEGSEAIEKTGRHRLYNAFIKSAFPNARMFVNNMTDEIVYKLN